MIEELGAAAFAIANPGAQISRTFQLRTFAKPSFYRCSDRHRIAARPRTDAMGHLRLFALRKNSEPLRRSACQLRAKRRQSASL
ncbi:MAG: hypothetical protein ABSC37_13930 [Xanthobacteraceae bacterium]